MIGRVDYGAGNFTSIANAHTKLRREKYRFEMAREPFARTYRMMSNLDDMHKNGRWVKDNLWDAEGER